MSTSVDVSDSLDEARTRLLRTARALNGAWAAALCSMLLLVVVSLALLVVAISVRPVYVVIWSVLLAATSYNLTRFWPRRTRRRGRTLSKDERAALRGVLDRGLQRGHQQEVAELGRVETGEQGHPEHQLALGQLELGTRDQSDDGRPGDPAIGVDHPAQVLGLLRREPAARPGPPAGPEPSDVVAGRSQEHRPDDDVHRPDGGGHHQ